MKKSFYILIISIIFFGFFGFNALAQATHPAQKAGDVVPIKEIGIDQANDAKNHCEYLGNGITTDDAARKICLATAPFYREIGKVDNKYYCCEPEGFLVVQTPLGPVAPAGQTAEQRLTATQQDWKQKYPGLYESSQPALERGLNLDWPNSPITNVNLKQLKPREELTGLVKYLYGWGISLGGLAAFIALVIAGFQYLTSAGNAGKMTDAISKIRSAAIGLVLLLASVLILNTINPQLTTLKMPAFTIGTEQIPVLPTKMEGIATEKCLGATLFSGANFTNKIVDLASVDSWDPGQTVNVGSVDIKGGLCELKLYQKSDFTEDADRPAATVSSDTRDMLIIANTTKFRSGKLINLFYPEMLKNQ